MRHLSCFTTLSIFLTILGCSGEEPTPGSGADDSSTQTLGETPTGGTTTTSSPTTPPPAVPKINLGSGGTTTAGTPSGAPSGNANQQLDPSEQREAVLAAMKPMQILRDSWNAIRANDIGGQNVGETQEWIWDFRTNRAQPALVMNSPGGKYFENLRLTYDVTDEQFEMTLTDADGKDRDFAGTYSVPVQEIEGDDRKIHRTYKLQLTEIDPTSPRENWQITINQQENNRYLLVLARKRGGGFLGFETIAAQREGTSFALNDSDYGEKTCIISGGLGTIAVSHKGKTYWVCCTGCKAAFEEEPDRWIADYEAQQAEKNGG